MQEQLPSFVVAHNAGQTSQYELTVCWQWGVRLKIPLYQIDAFADTLFSGNPAAVCPLDAWPADTLLQAIAAENNLSETAFFVPTKNGFNLRWFSPVREVDLCGHATLAAAHALFCHLSHSGERVVFHTRSGALSVVRNGDSLAMDFPASYPRSVTPPEPLIAGLGYAPLEVLAAEDYIVVLASEDDVLAIKPDQTLLGQLDLRGVCITAPGRSVDFVSRFFAPKYGIPEDPVTGSAHCQLATYWGAKLGATRLTARQVSQRGGTVGCELIGDRVVLSGSAKTYLIGEIVLS